jgi:hypothetical protein
MSKSLIVATNEKANHQGRVIGGVAEFFSVLIGLVENAKTFHFCTGGDKDMIELPFAEF